MSDQAGISKKDVKELKAETSLPTEVQQPRTSEGILHTAMLDKTKNFFSDHLFGSITETRKIMYSCALPFLIESVINSSPDNLKHVGVYFGVSAGLGLIEAAKKRIKGKTPKPVLATAEAPAI